MIRMSEATVVYENGTRAVNKASLRVDEGEFVFLVGASGSGKTTIIKLLTGEVRPSEGRVIVNNYDIGRMKKRQIPYLRRTLGVVYQDFRLINTKTVYENVAFAMRAIGAKGKALISAALETELGLAQDAELIVLCPACADDFRNAGLFHVRRANPGEPACEYCTVCCTNRGFEYVLTRKRGE